MVDINSLLQFLWEGDFLGFIQAVYVASFQNSDVFYGVLTLLFTAPLYIRTKSVILVSIIWVLLGGFFITLMPIVSGLALLLMIFGVAGLLFQVFMRIRG